MQVRWRPASLMSPVDVSLGQRLVLPQVGAIKFPTESASEGQVPRWGLPMITHIFITDPAVKDDYNRSLPSADVARFSQIVADAPRVSPSWLARPTTQQPTHSVWWSACSQPLCLMSSIRRPRSVAQASTVAL